MARILRLALLLVVVPGVLVAAETSGWSPARGRVFVVSAAGGRLVCSAAAVGAAPGGVQVPLHPINHLAEPGAPLEKRAGLTIQLRGTSQLDGFPDAKNAFLRAAAGWEAIIANPITIYIDVDFGPNRFGTPFPSGVLGSTHSDNYTGNYPPIRSALLATFPTSPIYNALPNGSVPTDLGLVASMISPGSTLRALALLPAAAASTDTAPSIGFNSAFPFDFDASDGVDPGRRDFEAVASHEIGHVLGFLSDVGATELSPPSQPALSIWDIFRFRPGTGTALGTAARILSSGGEQVFSRGGGDTSLSTGRPDGKGGDGNQASHWKDDEITNQWLGIMDPSLSDGVHPTVSYNDLLVLDAIGYTVNVNATASVSSISPPSVAQFAINPTVTVTGAGFLPGATALLDGRFLVPTRVLSSTSIQVTLPTLALYGNAPRSLTVQNPAAQASSAVALGVTATAGCPVEAHTLCLNNQRFLVRADWTTSDGNSGSGTAVPLTSDTGYFWFFSANNVEAVVKALNGCGFNSHYWVFAGGLTNVQVLLTVVDTANGTVKLYQNPINTAFQPIQDTAALATCP